MVPAVFFSCAGAIRLRFGLALALALGLGFRVFFFRSVGAQLPGLVLPVCFFSAPILYVALSFWSVLRFSGILYDFFGGAGFIIFHFSFFNDLASSALGFLLGMIFSQEDAYNGSDGIKNSL